MARVSSQKRDVLDALAGEILHNWGVGRRIVAVDGVEGSGTREFADDLATAIARRDHAVFRASLAGFHRPSAERFARGRGSAEGHYRDAFDYSKLRRMLVEPFTLGGSAGFVTAAFDARRDAEVEPKWLTAQRDAILVIDGVFLNRPELRGLWSYSVWLEMPEVDAKARREEVEGTEGLSPRYPGAQALYAKEAKPREAATAIVDNAAPEHPRRVFADAC
jgi:uridine kinase